MKVCGIAIFVLLAFFLGAVIIVSCGDDDDDDTMPDDDDDDTMPDDDDDNNDDDNDDGDDDSGDDDDDDADDDDDDNNDDDSVSMEVILDKPEDGATVFLLVRFSWHLVNPIPGETYNFILITDKGVNPCDGSGEDTWDVGEETSIIVKLDESRYRGQTVDWAVFAIDSDDNRICSDIRTFHVL